MFPKTIYYKHCLQTFVPDCEACQARVNGATDALAWEETITGGVAGL